MRKNHMMIATLAMLSVVGSAQYARAQQKQEQTKMQKS